MCGAGPERGGAKAGPVTCVTGWAVDELHGLGCLLGVVWSGRPGLGLQVQCKAKWGVVPCRVTGPTVLCYELNASLHNS